MTIDPHTGLLDAARFIASPNHNARPDGTVIDLLVIHNISLPAGEFGGPYVEQLFTNQLDSSAHPSFAELEGLKVSAHLFIRRTGEVIQFVPFNQRAWHAGVSQYDGRLNCNDFSIGIELEGTDTEAFTDQQYAQLADATTAIIEAYPGITVERITGHSNIAPERKTDPGPAFDWKRFLNQAGLA